MTALPFRVPPADAVNLPRSAGGERVRSMLIGLIAFLTAVDLFAAQAMLPLLAKAYGVTPAAMGSAVNASTAGMAVASLLIALVSRSIDRRRGIVLSLSLLSLPTVGLVFAPDLATFTVLRVVQGVFMASAFTLTLAYLGEHCGPRAAATAFAAYITGNVASNLIGRLLVASVADGFGLGPSFVTLAALNLAGAILVWVGLTHASAPVPMPLAVRSPLAILGRHGRNADLRRAFAIGFCILFAFIGTFTYVNFVLVGPPFDLNQRSLGLVYLVFVPSVVTTPLAGHAVRRLGRRSSLLLGLAAACLGLPLLVTFELTATLAGLALVAMGTFFAQAVATGLVSHAAEGDRGSASGLYLASYFAGGLVGSLVLGRVFDGFGWMACVLGIGASLVAAGALAARVPDAADASS